MERLLFFIFFSKLWNWKTSRPTYVFLYCMFLFLYWPHHISLLLLITTWKWQSHSRKKEKHFLHKVNLISCKTLFNSDLLLTRSTIGVSTLLFILILIGQLVRAFRWQWVCEGHCSFTLGRAATQIGVVRLEQVLTGTKNGCYQRSGSKESKNCSKNRPILRGQSHIPVSGKSLIR